MKLLIRPLRDRQRELDVTHRLVSAIAEELCRRYGGNDTLNWLEAEGHLRTLIGPGRDGTHETEEASAAIGAQGNAGSGRTGEAGAIGVGAGKGGRGVRA